MGSGQGRSKRIRATSAARQLLSYNPAVWGGFVSDNGLRHVTLSKYYLDKAEFSADLDKYNEVLREFFADIVALGAIVLPDGKTADDFDICFKARVNGSSVSVADRVVVVERSSGKKGEAPLIPDYYFQMNAALGSGLAHTLSQIWRALVATQRPE